MNVSESPTTFDANGRARFLFWGLALGCIMLIFLWGLIDLSKRTTPGTKLVYQLDAPSQASDLVSPLTNRLDGIANFRIRVQATDSGDIEVIIPSREEAVVERVERLIGTTGVMRFLVLANVIDHGAAVDRAIEQAGEPNPARTRDVLDTDGEIIGRWVTASQFTNAITGQNELRVDVSDFTLRDSSTGRIVRLPAELLRPDSGTTIAQWMAAQSIPSLDVLVSIEPELEVQGQHITFAAMTFDSMGSPAIAMSFIDEGSSRMFALTTMYAPQGIRQRRLGIILDDQLISAPNILSPIRSEARITGNFTREEVESMVQILRAGQLPVAMPKAPQSETPIDLPSPLAEFF